jgi:hypothetical protein
MLRRLARPIKIKSTLVVGVVPMARDKTVDTQPRMLPVDLARQLQPGTFGHALSHLLDHELDLTSLDARFASEATGASAWPPGLLVKLPSNTSKARSGTRPDSPPSAKTLVVMADPGV